MAEQSNSGSAVDVRTQTGLHQLIGYAELIKAAGVSRSTIERAWRGPWDPGEPHLPKPGKIGARSVWSAADANSWLLTRARWQCGMLETLAREQPDDLAPEELISSARNLIAQALSKRDGKPVDPAGMSIHTSRAVTLEEFKAAELREFKLLAERFADFGEGRALILAAWLFPSLRRLIAAGTEDEGAREVFQSPEQLGSLALHDDDWAEAEARLLAASRPVN